MNVEDAVNERLEQLGDEIKTFRRPRRKTPRNLPYRDLLQIVETIRALLYLDEDERGDFWSGSKTWGVETIEDVAQVLDEYGLVPPDNDRSL